MERPTVEEFKEYFADYFRFSPYDEWKKTTYDKDVFVLYNNEQYKSMKDENFAQPGDSSWWKEQVFEYNPDQIYNSGDYVEFEDKYYLCLEDETAYSPSERPEMWEEKTEEDMDVIFGSAWTKTIFLWSEGEYLAGDRVSHNGEFYIALEDTTEEPSEESTVWENETIKVFAESTEWEKPISYSMTEKVTYLERKGFTRSIYVSLEDANYSEPTKSENWEKSEESLSSYVLDSMIEEAMAEASTLIRPECAVREEDYKIAFMYATAHCLVMDWKMRNQGINAGGTAGIITGRTAGKMSAHYTISPLIQQYPQYEWWFKTPFGEKMMMIILKRRIGYILLAKGSWTSY